MSGATRMTKQGDKSCEIQMQRLVISLHSLPGIMIKDQKSNGKKGAEMK